MFEKLGYKKENGSSIWHKIYNRVVINIDENKLEPVVYVNGPINEEVLDTLNTAMKVAKCDMTKVKIIEVNAKIALLKNKGFTIANLCTSFTATKQITIDNYDLELVIRLNGKSGDVEKYYVLSNYDVINQNTIKALEKACKELENTVKELKK